MKFLLKHPTGVALVLASAAACGAIDIDDPPPDLRSRTGEVALSLASVDGERRAHKHAESSGRDAAVPSESEGEALEHDLRLRWGGGARGNQGSTKRRVPLRLTNKSDEVLDLNVQVTATNGTNLPPRTVLSWNGRLAAGRTRTVKADLRSMAKEPALLEYSGGLRAVVRACSLNSKRCSHLSPPDHFFHRNTAGRGFVLYSEDTKRDLFAGGDLSRGNAAAEQVRDIDQEREGSVETSVLDNPAAFVRQSLKNSDPTAEEADEDTPVRSHEPDDATAADAERKVDRP